MRSDKVSTGLKAASFRGSIDEKLRVTMTIAGNFSFFWYFGQSVVLTLVFMVAAASEATAQSSTPVETSPLASQLIETAPPVTTLQSIDSLFKRAVDLTGNFLFYRLGNSERSYIVYEPQAIYVRDRGTQGNFVLWEPADSQIEAELTPEDVEMLAARNLLSAGATIAGVHQNYRWGQLGPRDVEFVTVKQNDLPPLGTAATVHYGDKFILDPATGEYRKLGPKRGLLTSETISPETAEAWAHAGRLQTSDRSSHALKDCLFTEQVNGVPVVVGWLFFGSLVFTLYLKFVNVWGMKHALQILRGKYDSASAPGEVTHFQALSSALSGTVGLGNIAGVTVAMTIGGPGAFFWMLVSGMLGMATKLVECTLGVKYRTIAADGTVLGGPMCYLQQGLSQRGLGLLGVILSITFCILCIFASFGGGNMLQANQSSSVVLNILQQKNLQQLGTLNQQIATAAEQENAAELQQLQQKRSELRQQIAEFDSGFKMVFGLVLASAVGLVIVGGIRRIGAATEKLVPGMCLVYMSACLYIIAKHFDRIPEVISTVFSEAFTGTALGGGVIGAMVIGIQRAAFSNEAGAGSSPIAHSAAKTGIPVREGFVALLEPFIDTVVICSMTAMVILITGAWDNDYWILEQNLQGSALTAQAFRQEISWFPHVLGVAVMLFAYSTIISWSYYGERAWAYLFGIRTIVIYRVLAVASVFVGTVVNLGSVIDFSDMMMLGLAFPNIAGLLILAPMVRKDLLDYWKKYQAEEAGPESPSLEA